MAAMDNADSAIFNGILLLMDLMLLFSFSTARETTSASAPWLSIVFLPVSNDSSLPLAPNLRHRGWNATGVVTVHAAWTLSALQMPRREAFLAAAYFGIEAT